MTSTKCHSLTDIRCSTQTDHIFPDSLVIVKEDVPSTIIAYTLSCEDYLEKLHNIHDNHDGSSHSSVVADTLEHQHADWLELAPTKDTHTSSQAYGMEKTLLSDTGTHMRYRKQHLLQKKYMSCWY
jgi:1-phosphatidylinositol-3-phosphate 5-kinase